MKFRTNSILLITVLCLFAAACGQDFATTLQERAEGKPIQLDSEQVSLTLEQLKCGVKYELWDGAPEGGQQAVYRLTQKGRELQFSDNIYPNGPGYPSPYTQVRGKFHLQFTRIVEISDGSDGSKLVQAQLGVKIPHPCFAAALPVMGIRKGKFTPDEAPTLKYENAEDGWQPAELVH